LSRRPLITILLATPVFLLVIWLALSQLSRWTAPQPNWFPAGTPGVCAAVSSLALYAGQRSAVSGIGPIGAQTAAAQVFAEQYGAEATDLSEPLAVQANLPGEPRQALYVITARINRAAAVVYLGANDGTPRALITTPDAEDTNCAFDIRGALVAALRSPPMIVLATYLLFAAAFIGWRLVRTRTLTKGTH
jgi:hypothetical protein